jgi:N-methylhydantoinase B
MVPLPDKVTIEVEVQPGDRIRYVLPSGGGHGHAHDRDVDAVVEDVREGKCSLEEAERVYGVSVDTDRWVGVRTAR